eukprot:3233405-Pyramimonas_sp.AAC.1
MKFEGAPEGFAAKEVAERMQTKGTTEPLLKSKCSLFKPDPVTMLWSRLRIVDEKWRWVSGRATHRCSCACMRRGAIENFRADASSSRMLAPKFRCGMNSRWHVGTTS